MVFLAAACGLTMWVCVGYLKLQADNTASVKHIASLETQLSELREENDDEYNRVMTSVDLEKIRISPSMNWAWCTPRRIR